jgi:SNF2 family DNA or RNA helicase
VSTPTRGSGEVTPDPVSGMPGHVEIQGRHIVVTPPATMTGAAVRRLANRLGAVAAAKATEAADGTTLIRVPARHAPDVQRELSQAWPGVGHEWRWSDAARGKLRAVIEQESRLSTLLNTTDRPSAAELGALLEMGGFARALLPTQTGAVAQLVMLGSGGNFSVPGSGKTTMTLAVYAALKARGDVDRALVIAPLSAHEAWQVETTECFRPGAAPRVAIRPRAWARTTEVVVVNYEHAASAGAGPAFDRWAAGHRVLVVYDEAHRAKRGETGRHGAAAAMLASRATHRLVLTGTPMPNSLQDLTTVLDLAWPGHGDRLAEGDLATTATSAWVRLTKDDLGLIAPQITSETVRLDADHRKVYDIVAAQAADLAANGVLDDRPELATKAIMRTIAVAANPAAILDEQLRWNERDGLGAELVETDTHLRETIHTSRPAKLLRVASLAREHQEAGTKLLVWSHFLPNITELVRLLEPYGVAVVTGGTAVDDDKAETDRIREITRFRTDPVCTVLVATPQTLGEGVSLHKACQSQVFLDRTFNAGLYLQALDRTHRVGMPDGTVATATTLIAKDTIDEDVDAALRRKISAMQANLDDPSLTVLTLPDERDAPVLDRDEIGTLLGHLRQRRHGRKGERS